MRASFAVVLCLPVALLGCSFSPTVSSTPQSGSVIRGAVHGGQFPLAGAQVYLLAANVPSPASAAANAGPGIAPSSANLSASLLQNEPGTGPGTTTLDTSTGPTNGFYYTTTDANGTFTITSDYSCTPNTQVYLYVLGGDPYNDSGATFNAASGLMAVLGNCPVAGNFLAATPYVVVNEVTTVAAAYAMAGYASDAVHVSSSGTALAQTGIQNAFANASNLADLPTGTALATTPLANGGNGAVPQSEIYALADILATCVNTSGAITGPTNPTDCYTLLNSALSAGTSGTVPSDTATAAINIAHNPSANVPSLFGLIKADAPFATSYAQPTDFTVGIQFAGGGVKDPYAIAIDGSGNAWVTNNGGGSSLTELSNTGAALSPSTGYKAAGLAGIFSLAIDANSDIWLPSSDETSVFEFSALSDTFAGSSYSGGNIDFPYAAAIDPSGNVWVTNNGANSVDDTPGLTVLAGSSGAHGTPGTILSGTDGYMDSLARPIAIAIDGGGNVWVGDNNNNNVTEFSSSGGPLNVYSGGGLATPYSMAVDHTGNVWVSSYGDTVTELPVADSYTPSAGITGGGISHPYSIAVDGAGNIWTANSGSSSLTELTNAGAAVSPSTGYTACNVGSTDYVAVDGSGNIWAGDPYNNVVTEVIGAAVPVVTPIAAGVANNTLGTRP